MLITPATHEAAERVIAVAAELGVVVADFSGYPDLSEYRAQRRAAIKASTWPFLAAFGSWRATGSPEALQVLASNGLLTGSHDEYYLAVDRACRDEHLEIWEGSLGRKSLSLVSTTAPHGPALALALRCLWNPVALGNPQIHWDAGATSLVKKAVPSDEEVLRVVVSVGYARVAFVASPIVMRPFAGELMRCASATDSFMRKLTRPLAPWEEELKHIRRARRSFR